MNWRLDAGKDRDSTENRFSKEMRGYVDLGMHAEAVKLARKFLGRDSAPPSMEFWSPRMG
jgi:hypothetical protein